MTSPAQTDVGGDDPDRARPGMDDGGSGAENPPPAKHLTIRQAAFIGVGAMVGAGIFSLLGAAGEVAGAAVWLSFLIAGAIAILNGYSFAKFGARFPSAGGLLEYIARGFGDGHVTGVVAWIVLATNAIVTGMVAVSFGSYASDAVPWGNSAWVKIFAALIVVVMTMLNIVGSQAVARVQTVVVTVVIGILAVFAVVTLVNMDPHLLAFSGYPSVRDIVSSVALTFFAFLGFGIVSFTAKDLANPSHELPRAMYLALGIATVIYVAVALGVFGTLTVEEVIASGGTAIAKAAEPTLGTAGYWLMSVTALFATSGATNGGLYPASGLCEQLASVGQFPPVMGRRLAERAPTGLLLTAVIAIVLAVGFDLNAIASIGSAIALVVFALVTVGHLRVRDETGARLPILLVGVAATVIVLVTFTLTTLVHEPSTLIAILVVLLVSVGLDVGWKRSRSAHVALP
jgi:amino acid transporter